MLNLYQVELLSMGTMCECWMCTRWDVEYVPRVEVLSVYKVGC